MISRCGYVAIIGRPNVGKSTLLNMILGQKISITSRKPQTTRHQLLGIKTVKNCQVVYVDTPGIHRRESKAINRYMNRAALSILDDVDVVLFLLDRTAWLTDDQKVADALNYYSGRLILAINKIDRLKSLNQLLPRLSKLHEAFPQAELVPISASTGENITRLESLIHESIPKAPFFFPENQITDRSERFLVAEMIREKLTRQLGEEVPYMLTIQVDRFEVGVETAEIDATIFVEKEGQKAILIGKKGGRLKQIGSDARKDIEKLLNLKVMLTTWVKVKSGWSDNERTLQGLGYNDVRI
ncbi:MAG: GTPase Era [Gammaproteobacteria bacterium TMED1]|nr:MAG: GTPase Era [Gammaproteobacteria bacterium TMED1]|tara:strand:- start:782 stop:1678 length:897 start_codon:yes stop_codon:yes gene_type:complete